MLLCFSERLCNFLCIFQMYTCCRTHFFFVVWNTLQVQNRFQIVNGGTFCVQVWKLQIGKWVNTLNKTPLSQFPTHPWKTLMVSLLIESVNGSWLSLKRKKNNNLEKNLSYVRSCFGRLGFCGRSMN